MAFGAGEGGTIEIRVETTQGIQELDKLVGKFNALDGAAKQTGQAAKQSGADAASGGAGFAAWGKEVTIAAASGAALVASAGVLISKMKEYAELGGRVSDVSARFVGNLNQLRAATSGEVDDMTLMVGANRAFANGLNLSNEQLAVGAEFAKRYAETLDQDFGATYDTVMRALATGRGLKNFNLDIQEGADGAVSAAEALAAFKSRSDELGPSAHTAGNNVAEMATAWENANIQFALGFTQGTALQKALEGLQEACEKVGIGASSMGGAFNVAMAQLLTAATSTGVATIRELDAIGAAWNRLQFILTGTGPGGAAGQTGPGAAGSAGEAELSGPRRIGRFERESRRNLMLDIEREVPDVVPPTLPPLTEPRRGGGGSGGGSGRRNAPTEAGSLALGQSNATLALMEAEQRRFEAAIKQEESLQRLILAGIETRRDQEQLAERERLTAEQAMWDASREQSKRDLAETEAVMAAKAKLNAQIEGMTQAMISMTLAGIQQGIASGKSTEDILSDLATQAGWQAAMETAAGLGSLAITWGIPNPSSINHFLSAAGYGALALGAMAVGGGGGGGGSSGAGRVTSARGRDIDVSDDPKAVLTGRSAESRGAGSTRGLGGGGGGGGGGSSREAPVINATFVLDSPMGMPADSQFRRSGKKIRELVKRGYFD